MLVDAAGPLLQVAGDLGVRRISVGGALARMAWTGFMKASKQMAEQGTFTEFTNGYPGGERNKMFG
jgi:methylisocitrate lyase